MNWVVLDTGYLIAWEASDDRHHENEETDGVWKPFR